MRGGILGQEIHKVWRTLETTMICQIATQSKLVNTMKHPCYKCSKKLAFHCMKGVSLVALLLSSCC
jgi:hypothetical protein